MPPLSSLLILALYCDCIPAAIHKPYAQLWGGMVCRDINDGEIIWGHPSKEIKMANKCVKKVSISLATKILHDVTVIKHHHTEISEDYLKLNSGLGNGQKRFWKLEHKQHTHTNTYACM